MHDEMPNLRPPSRLVVSLLFFFSLVAPSPIWSALGVRGFMLLAVLLCLLLLHLVRSGRLLSSRVLVGCLSLFLLAGIPCFFWSDLRLMFYPIFFVSSVLLVSQATVEERDAYVDLATRFLTVLLVGAVLGYAFSALSLPPLGSLNNTDGRPNFFFYTTLSNSFEDGFLRPSGIYDEPGAFSFFVCMIAFIRHVTGRSSAGTLILLTLGLITFSLTHMLFLVFYILTYATSASTLSRLALILSSMVGVVFIVGSGDLIVNKVLSRLVINDDGELAGDTRSLLLSNAVLVLTEDRQAALMGADASCTLDPAICAERFGPMGENPLSPLVSQGLFLSWPYYVFLLVSLTAILRGRRGLMFFAVGLLFVQRPYLMNLGYSLLGVIAFQAHRLSLGIRSTPFSHDS